MSDRKKELINIQQQIQNLINSLRTLEQHIQDLIDGSESDHDRIPEAIEAEMNKLGGVLGRSLYQQLKAELSEEIVRLLSQQLNQQKSSKPESNISSYTQNQNTVLQTESLGGDKNTPNSSVNAYLQRMVDLYNQNPNHFTNTYATLEVDVTPDSIITIRTQSNSSVILDSSSNRGKFWVVESDGSSYLFPNSKQSVLFHEHNLDVLRALFHDSSYYNGYRKVYVITPAKIEPFESTNAPAWQLIEKGNISFV